MTASKFYNGDIPNGVPAYTNPNYEGSTENHTIKIKLDNTFLNTATDIGIINAVMHELTHAYLIHLYLKGTLVATNSNFNTLQNAFMAFYDSMVQDTFDTLDNEIHNAIIDFISKITNSIYNYSISKNISGVNPQYCEQLVWGAMNNTDLFNSTLTTQQQQDYENTTAIEQDNLAGAKGTPCGN